MASDHEDHCHCYEWLGFGVFWLGVAWIASKLAKGIWTSWVGSLLGFSHPLKPGANSWAIITGANDGIGFEYSLELGKKGYSLLLIGRSAEKLEAAKEKIKAKAKSKEIRTLVVDFSSLDIYPKIAQELEKLGDLDVLVNNVGLSFCTPEYFSHLGVTNDAGFIDKLINVNIVSTTKMIELVLPRMEKQRRGVIINLSSLSAAYPTPLLSVYGAAKNYVDSLSRALQIEYAPKGIVVQSVLPSYVATKMSKIRNSSFLVPFPSGFVKGALKTVGLEDRTYGYWTHKLQGFVQDHVIAGIAGAKTMSNIAFNSLKGIRAAYYKKKTIVDKNK